VIMRTWYGKVPTDKADAFEAYLKETGVVDIPGTSGNQSMYAIRRRLGELTEFGVISLWDSEESIRAFAGGDPRRFRYYPRDAEFLVEMPSIADHYEVIARS